MEPSCQGCLSRRRRFRQQALVAAIGLLVWLVPLSSLAYSPAWFSTWYSCGNNLKQIAIALHKYHDEFGSFPPAVVRDKVGRPMHSWRVLLLPFLEEQELYERYNFDEPWDSQHNLQLATSIPPAYYCSLRRREAEASGYTNYFVPVGPDTAWPPTGARHFGEITDGTGNTVLVVADHSRNTVWLEPTDLASEAVVSHVSALSSKHAAEHWGEDFFTRHLCDCHAVLADGQLSPLRFGLDPQLVTSLITIDDGASLPDLHHECWKVRRVTEARYGNWFIGAVASLIYVMGFIWLGRKSSPLFAIPLFFVVSFCALVTLANFGFF